MYAVTLTGGLSTPETTEWLSQFAPETSVRFPLNSDGSLSDQVEFLIRVRITAIRFKLQFG